MSASPIDILDNDILLSIFDTITAKIPLRKVRRINRPLTTIRVTSQVCQRWRALLLASPWVWGRLIDLGGVHDNWKRLEWIEEVARRSGSTAPLWIYGEVGDLLLPANIQQYFIQRLESWERVEKLSVSITTREKAALFDYVRNRFLSPAPILELFEFSCFNTPTLYLDTLQSGPSKRLFADYAPSLRRIRANRVAYRLDSPWLSNICEILPFPKHLTLEDIFVILQRTPAIERISISNNDLLWVQPPFSKLNFLKLSCVSLCTSPLVGAVILNHITPGILTSFYMLAQDLQAEALNQSYILSSFKDNLPPYFSNYFSANSPTALSFGIGYRFFRLCDVTTDTNDGYPQNFEVMISTSFSDQYQHDWDNLVACLLDAFTASTTQQGNPSLFVSVTQLRLSRVEVPPALIPKLYSMLGLLRHVKDIYAEVRFGHNLLALFDMASDSGNPQHVLFPQLHTLHLRTQDTDIITDSMLAVFTQFMARRKKLGFPVAKLDLTNCRGSKRTEDLYDLEDLDGLEGSENLGFLVAALELTKRSESKRTHDLCDLEALDELEVVWEKSVEKHGESSEICSYVCGTGEPERLKCLI